MEKIVRLKRELVAEGSIINYYHDTMQIPNGNIVQWDFIGHKGAAAVIPVREDGKIFMVRQFRGALDMEILEIPAGGLTHSEEPTKEAALRELEEEIGYKCNHIEFLISIRTTVAFCNEKIDIYVATDLVPSVQCLDEDEYLEVEAYTLEELNEKIFQGEITDSKTVSAILAYQKKYK